MKTRLWPIGWLATVVLIAQLMLAIHGIGHVFERDHDADGHSRVCLECLALAGVHGAPPPALPAPAAPLVVIATEYAAVPPAPTFAFLPAYRSRAPPIRQS